MSVNIIEYHLLGQRFSLLINLYSEYNRSFTIVAIVNLIYVRNYIVSDLFRIMLDFIFCDWSDNLYNGHV